MPKTIHPITSEECLRKLAALCARGEHSSGEMLEKIHRWGLTSDDECQRILHRLIRDKYIDDARFTRSYALDKLRYNGWGRKKIEQGLYIKGITKDIYKPILDDIPDEEYLGVLRPLIQNKMRQIKAKSNYERAMKTIKFTLSRGFSMELIRACIDEANDIDDV
jgi:regulatory protein